VSEPPDPILSSSCHQHKSSLVAPVWLLNSPILTTLGALQALFEKVFPFAASYTASIFAGKNTNKKNDAMLLQGAFVRNGLMLHWNLMGASQNFLHLQVVYYCFLTISHLLLFK
jgi:hypothetical protein